MQPTTLTASTPLLTASSPLIALIGDVHAEDDLLDSALRELQRRGVEVALCVGDLVDGVGDVARCCELLQQYDVLTVRGNHDRWLMAGTMRDLPHATSRDRLSVEVSAYLDALPATRVFATPFGSALLCHGLGENDMASVSPDDFGYALDTNTELCSLIDDPTVQLVFNGHTHRRMVRHFDGLTIVNAGTLHLHQEPGVVLVDLASGEVSWLPLEGRSAAETAPLGKLRAQREGALSRP